MLASSISIPVAELFTRPRRGRVLATFTRSAYIDVEGSIVAVVAAELLNGPLNVVLAEPTPPFAQLTAGAGASAANRQVVLEGWPPISLQAAGRWDPRIRPWSTTETRRAAAHLEVLGGRVLAEAPADHLRHPRMKQGLAGLQAALRDASPGSLAAAASRIAGLGGGLTPTGDDVLVGVLVTLTALPHKGSADLRTAIRAGAAGRTTRISEAYLEAAARGEASEGWQRLLAALGSDDRHSVIDAGRDIVALGETSGTDMLTGFMLALQTLAPVPMGGR